MITLDTNILVYLSDDDEPDKQAVARTVLSSMDQRDAAIGLQVIGELQNVLRRKLRQPPWIAAQTARNVLVAFPSFGATPTSVETALTQAATGRLGYWDALLVASARESGCEVLLTEDLQDGANVLGVEIVNPFGAGGLSDRARAVLGL